LELGPFGGSARLILMISSQLLIFLLTCQVAMPLGITLVFGLCLCDYREQCDALDEDQDPLGKISMMII
jgi:hypothetical protein